MERYGLCPGLLVLTSRINQWFLAGGHFVAAATFSARLDIDVVDLLVGRSRVAELSSHCWIKKLKQYHDLAALHYNWKTFELRH